MPQCVAYFEQELHKSADRIDAALDRIVWMVWCYCMVRTNRQGGWHEIVVGLEKMWCSRCILKAGIIGTDGRWSGNSFQMLDATEDNEFNNFSRRYSDKIAVIVFWSRRFKRSREDVFWENFSEVRRLLVLQHLGSNGSNFEDFLLAHRETVQANQDWCDVTSFLRNNTGKCVFFSCSWWNRLSVRHIVCLLCGPCLHLLNLGLTLDSTMSHNDGPLHYMPL